MALCRLRSVQPGRLLHQSHAPPPDGPGLFRQHLCLTLYPHLHHHPTAGVPPHPRAQDVYLSTHLRLLGGRRDVRGYGQQLGMLRPVRLVYVRHPHRHHYGLHHTHPSHSFSVVDGYQLAAEDQVYYPTGSWWLCDGDDYDARVL